MGPEGGFEAWLRAAFGRRLVRVLGTFFLSPTDDENASGEPLALWLEFDGLPFQRVKCASDGWTLCTEQGAPESLSMGTDGSVVVRELTASALFRDVRTELSGAELILDSDVVVGFALRFVDGGALLILNWGDELFVSAGQLPLDSMDDQLDFVPV